ncbi:MAG: DNA-processing protein DprA [Cellulomonas sp.]|nr:DNA-processing protein DprA [Cellulomonas sp.]MCR6647033.1 DNA-processing protein DprA [Cellulomonas sp.]
MSVHHEAGGTPVVDEQERWARAAWSALAEPGDVVAGALLAQLGAVQAWQWVVDSAAGLVDVPARAAPTGDAPARLVRAVERWAPRMTRLAAEGWSVHRPPPDGVSHVRVLVPGDREWPAGLDDLGAAAPACLWVRGDPAAARWPSTGRARTAALVGARAATAYGERVAIDLAAGLVDAGFVVVSGGAYGVDAAAHRGALASGGRTLVVVAGGVDRAYPAGNVRLIEEAVASGGAVVGEVPPGSLPTRSRFLQRNRLIAALGTATVVVEAAWRSGALSTANHAARLNRPVGAVPGPVTSMASAGCHRLLREGVATCVTDAAEVVELAGAVGADLAPEPRVAARGLDGVDALGRRVHDALGTRTARPTAEVARVAGVTTAEAIEALGSLELAGLARHEGSGWRAKGVT